MLSAEYSDGRLSCAVSKIHLEKGCMEVTRRSLELKAKTRMSRRLGFLGTKSYMDLLAFGGDVKPGEGRPGAISHSDSILNLLFLTRLASDSVAGVQLRVAVLTSLHRRTRPDGECQGAR